MKVIIETPRLLLAEFTVDDFNFVMEITNSADWLRFIGDRNTKTKETAIAYLENGPIKSYQVNGFGLYKAVLKDTLETIGICGIIRRDILAFPDIGYALLPQYTGNGYAAEMAGATKDYAVQVLKLPNLLAITDPENERSEHLLKKIGLSFRENIMMAGGDKELNLFSVYPL